MTRLAANQVQEVEAVLVMVEPEATLLLKMKKPSITTGLFLFTK